MSTGSARRGHALVALLTALMLIAAACGDDTTDDAADTSAETEAEDTASASTTDETPSDDGTADGDDAASAFAERCEANRAAGTITYLSAFDFAAAASILDVIVADAEGYFEELCLDVEIVPGFAPTGGLVAQGQAQFSSAGSFGEVVNTNVQGEADLVAIAHYGKTSIEELIVPADSEIAELTDLEGATVGIKGDLPYSLQAMLGQAGVERSSLDEPLLDGFDPVAHLELGIDALPVYKSNEPAQLDAAGVEYRVFDPREFDVPSSFGVFFTSSTFLEEHPTAVEDFLRASFRGFQFAVDDPETAVGHAFERIDAAGNPAFLSAEGEGFRWVTESSLVLDTTPTGEGPGLIDIDRFGAEIELLTEVGVFEELPDWEPMLDASVAAELYEGTDVVWPVEG
ncbi:MAG: ABC transporter substrate-binding protein [Actinomycetota bacterium]